MQDNEREKKKRYAYIKNGDVVDQVQRIVSSPNYTPTSGPDAFIFDFLRRIGDSPLLALSRSNRTTGYTHKNIDARVFNIKGVLVKKVFLKSYATLKIFLLLIRFKPDRIVCGVTGSAFWSSYSVAWIYSIPFVHSEHNQLIVPEGSLLRRLRASINFWLIRKATAVICHGPYLKDELKKIGVPESRIFSFDVGFEDMLKEGIRSQGDLLLPDELNNSEIILYMGRIEADKGIFDLLKASSDSLVKNEQLRLVYAGDGSQRHRLEKEITARQLEKKVLTLGRMPHDKLVDLLKKTKVLVTPTQRHFPEGRCMSAMEGLVMGLPVIAPDFGPFPYLVHHEVNGLLYKTNSVEALKSRIQQLVEDDRLYEKLCAGARVTANQLIRPHLTFGEAIDCAFREERKIKYDIALD